ncbi:hypothetical protein HORIV_01570 [Vreelandella olivaria]|uniref:Uncharacterized protein n=1 Tax=Vreelandella olivaria TaxID=390919 RepID=A0ABN5WL43_9GAMM|nr:hypothetical protein HORIV_01570 [Halomonas olivaria]
MGLVFCHSLAPHSVEPPCVMLFAPSYKWPPSACCYYGRVKKPATFSGFRIVWCLVHERAGSHKAPAVTP